MRAFVILILLFLSLSAIAFADDPPIMLWKHTYGGGQNDVLYSITRTGDGGYALAGFTSSEGNGGEDVYIVKVDEDGEEQWSATFGGRGDDEARCIINTEDGGYAISGQTNSFGEGENDVYLIKLNIEGEEEWTQTHGGARTDWAVSLVQTTDGGYAYHGVTCSQGEPNGDYWFVKAGADGELQYDLHFGGGGIDLGWSKIFELDEFSYAFSGCTFSFGEGACDFYPIKIANEFEVVWANNYGTWRAECCRGFVTTDDGGFVGVGPYSLDYQTYDMIVQRIDGDGNEIWQHVYDFNDTDWAQAVVQTSDGGFAVGGYTSSRGNGNDFMLVKLNSEGELQWSEVYGGGRDDICCELIETGEDEFLMVGYTVSYGAGGTDGLLMKVGHEEDPPNEANPEIAENPNGFALYTTYPNPFNSKATVRYSLDFASEINLNVFNMSGKKILEVEKRQMQPGSYTVDFDCSELASGTYIARLESLGRLSETKLILVK